MSFSCTLLVLILTLRALVWSQSTWDTSPTTVATIQSSAGNFGSSISMTNDFMVVGASSSGQAMIYTRDKATNVWTTDNPTNTITSPDSAEKFGTSVGISDAYLIVGAPGQLKAYLFRYDTTAKSWGNSALSTTDALVCFCGYSGQARFGQSVAMAPTGDYAIVGAPTAKKAYVFAKSKSDSTWSSVAQSELVYTDTTSFGTSVDITANYAIVGCPVAANKAYIFKRSSTQWTMALYLDNYYMQGDFGTDVAISDNYAIVTAKGPKKAFIFEKDEATDTWSKTAIATIDAYTQVTSFGMSVAMSSNYAIIGATEAKKAFIFKLVNGAWGTTAVATIDRYTSTNNVGSSVAITDTRAAVGGTGAVYLFANTNTCGAGTYLDDEQCKSCPAGKYSVGAADVCTPCPAGTYSLVNGGTSESSCEDCDAGRYSSSTGAPTTATCQLCPAGTYGSDAGLSKCVDCAAGKYNTNVGEESDSCVACPEGKTSDSGASAVDKCYINMHWGSTAITDIDGYASSAFGTDVTMTDKWAMVGGYLSNKVYIFRRDMPMRYPYHGCTPQGNEYAAVRNPDAWTANNGYIVLDKCQAECVSKNYNYFGLECPTETSTVCRCYTDESVASMGKTSSGSTAECTNSQSTCTYTPKFTYAGDIYWMGGYETGSIYSVTKNEQPMTWADGAADEIVAPTSERGFGYRVAISNTMAIISSRFTQKAFFYQFNDITYVWNLTPLATISAYSEKTDFGSSLAITTNWAAVGASGDNTVYLFYYTTSANSWATTATVTITESSESKFGYSVAMTDNYLIVGAYGSSKAFVYKYTDPNWSTSPVATFDSYTSPASSFGASVAMTDKYAIVGSNSAKKAYVFAYDTTAGAWGSAAASVIDGYTSETNFGFSVSITDNYAFVGAYTTKKAFIFARDATTGDWSTQSKVTTLDSYTAQGGFGIAVAMTDNFGLVGASTANKAYIFADVDSCDPGYYYTVGKCNLCETGKYSVATASVTCTSCEAGKYSDAAGGSAASVCKDCPYGKYSSVVAGVGESSCTQCPSGKYTMSAGSSSSSACSDMVNWDFAGPVSSINKDQKYGVNGFGYTVAHTDQYLVIGAPSEKKAYIFGRDDKTVSGVAWGTSAVAAITGYTSNELFGRSVDIYGDYVIIGAPDAKAAFIFKRDASTGVWDTTAAATMDESTCAGTGNIGWDVAIGRNWALVSASITMKVYVFQFDPWSEGWDINGDKKATPVATISSTETGFGNAISMNDKATYAIVGTNNGATGNKVFILARSSTNVWGIVTTIDSSLYSGYKQFGLSVDISDNWAVAGASDDGKAVVFARDSSSASGTWSATGMIITNKKQLSSFGKSVSITDSWVLVGASEIKMAYMYATGAITDGMDAESVSTWFSDSNSYFPMFGQATSLTNSYASIGGCNLGSPGEIFVFKNSNLCQEDAYYSAATGTCTACAVGKVSAPGATFCYVEQEWDTNTPALAIENQVSSTDFGWHVAMTDDYAIVGAEGASKAFIYARTNGTWSDTAVATLSGTTGSEFGSSVAITDSFAVVGDTLAKKAYIFAFDATSSSWDISSPVTIESYTTIVNFGYRAAMDGNYILITANSATIAYVFEYDTPTKQWGTSAVATLNNPGSSSFGQSADICGDTLVIGGSLANTVWLYVRASGTWSTTPSVTFNKYTENYFGASVGITDQYLIVGASVIQKAYIFTHDNGGTWDTTAVAVIDGYATVAGFGDSVAIAADSLIVGAPDSQKAYVFTRDPETGKWGNIADYTIDNQAASTFGINIAMTLNYAIVGARTAAKAFIYANENECAGGTYLQDGECVACDAGKYSLLGGQGGQGSCSPCAEGTYAKGLSNTKCTDCPAGYYTKTTGTDECSACAQGKYSTVVAAKNETVCVSCPTDTTSYPGSSSASACGEHFPWSTTANAAINPVGNIGDKFGSSVAITNAFVLVGAEGAKKASFYARTGTPGTWITSPPSTDLTNYNAYVGFGHAVSMTDSFAAVSADLDCKVFIFAYDSSSAKWGDSDIATFSGGVTESFGQSLVIVDSHLLVGAPGSSTVYIYSRAGESSTWTLTPSATIDGYTSVSGFGMSVAATDKYALVGAPNENRAYFFACASDGTWGTTAVALLNFPMEDDFGRSVTLTDYYAAVGAKGANGAFIFARDTSTSGTGAWGTDVLVRLDDYTTESGFGGSVSMTNDYLAVGAEYAKKVFMFAKDPSNDVWAYTAIATIDTYTSEAEFGRRVAVTDYFCAVGAAASNEMFIFKNGNDCPAGEYSDNGVCAECPPGKYSVVQGSISETICEACEVSKYQDSTGSTSCLPCPAGTSSTTPGGDSASTCLGPPTPMPTAAPTGMNRWGNTAQTVIDTYSTISDFSRSVANTDDFLIVGSSTESKAFIFVRDATTSLEFPTTASTVIDAYTNEGGFGISVGITDKHAIVGAFASMKAFIFSRNVTGDGAWPSTASAIIDAYTGTNFFGCSVAITNSYAIVGARGVKKAYIFVFNSGLGVWDTTAGSLLDGYTDIDEFGYSVGITDNFAVVGAPVAGKVYVFARDAGLKTWSSVAVTQVLAYTAEGSFGFSVSITDKYCMVGSFGSNKAFIFNNDGSSWSTTADTVFDGYTSIDRFGYDVHLTDNFAVVGSHAAKKALVFAAIPSTSSWATTAQVVIDSYTSEDGFAGTVSISDSYAVVGSRLVNKAYIFFNQNDCTAGYYSANTQCVACPAGRYGSLVGAVAPSSCTKCEVGKYSTTTPATDASTCLVCGEGKQSEAGSGAETDCMFPPTPSPTFAPTQVPTPDPSTSPTIGPSAVPTVTPTAIPTFAPTFWPTHAPSPSPTVSPTVAPSTGPSKPPTPVPTERPTFLFERPSRQPTVAPTLVPTSVPTKGTGESNADSLSLGGDAVGSSERLIVILVPICSLLFCAAFGFSIYYLVFLHRPVAVFSTGDKEGEDGLTLYEQYYVGHRQYSESELRNRKNKGRDDDYSVGGVELGQVRSLDDGVLSPMQQQLSSSESPLPDDRRQNPGIDILYEDKSDDNSTKFGHNPMFPMAAGYGVALSSVVTDTTSNPMLFKHATPAGGTLGPKKSPLSAPLRGLHSGTRVGPAAAGTAVAGTAVADTAAADTADTTSQVLISPGSAIMEESSSSDSDSSDGSSDGEHEHAAASASPEPDPEAASTNQGVPSTTPDNGVDNSDTNKAAIASPVVIEEQEEDI